MPHTLTSTPQRRTAKPARRAWRSAAATAITLAATACSVTGAAGPASAVAAKTDCTPVRIIAARATGESPGAGVIGSLARLVKGQLSAPVTREALAYPATLAHYARSAAKGDKALAAGLARDAQRCPSQVFVLLGYSQGAQVVGDVLGGGGGGALGTVTPGVPAALARKIVAVIQMGDPRRMPGLAFDKGTAPGATGQYPRRQSQSLAGFAAKIRSYCDTGDPICARGNNLQADFGYTDRYNRSAARFVLRRLAAAGIT
jgi:acetylxylan esterase